MSDHEITIDQLRKDHKLTYRQASFVYHFTGNASEAARIVGYANPGQAGSRLLKDAKIVTAIQARTAAQPDTIMSPDMILQRWTAIANDPLVDHKTRHDALTALARSHAMFTDKSISLNYNKNERMDQLTDHTA
jgi:hypothetical protein